VTVSVPVLYSEADGDPVLVDGEVCGSSGCAISATLTSPNLTQTYTRTISDGVASSTLSVTVSAVCPTVGASCTAEAAP
jgi:hypothetical protein